MIISELDIDPICDSLPGIIYIVDREGQIVYYGKKLWNSFAKKSDALNLLEESNVMNKSIFEFIDGESVKHTYRLYHQVLLDKVLEKINVFCNCDSPDMVRELFLSISLISDKSDHEGLLYQSIVLKEEKRTPVKLLMPKENKLLPNVTICSFCMRINDGSTDEWVGVETYNRLGGNDQVSLLQDVCPDCKAKYVYPYQGMIKN